KEFKVGRNGKNNVIAMNVTFVNIGGNRATPIDTAASQAEFRTVYFDSLAYNEKLADYIRLDAKISYRQNKTKITQEFGFDIRNILNRKNVFSRYYNAYTHSIEYSYQIGIFPVAF